jgi:hypothetical protein
MMHRARLSGTGSATVCRLLPGPDHRPRARSHHTGTIGETLCWVTRPFLVLPADAPVGLHPRSRHRQYQQRNLFRPLRNWTPTDCPDPISLRSRSTPSSPLAGIDFRRPPSGACLPTCQPASSLRQHPPVADVGWQDPLHLTVVVNGVCWSSANTSQDADAPIIPSANTCARDHDGCRKACGYDQGRRIR